ncbi:hypothetical protein PoB_005260900 [Plakobranchus ocellatus]|uniref:Uncharacterized protein n=1 Tax=Plakobranchus ocellatus TaxID=259542 RepID=A0AAV4C0Q8_9GAST|nr:hypothetical protein PoB_005260900 [Plakobranchus ocellatus]
MVVSKGYICDSGKAITYIVAVVLGICLIFPKVSSQILRSLPQPTLLQTNGIGFQNSDPSSFVLDLSGQNSANLGFGSQTFVNPALINNNAGRYPTISGVGGASALNGYQRRSHYPEIYTAIGIDTFDSNSQVRLTITERFNNPRFSSFDAPTDWYVQGTFLNSQLKNKAGTYYVVLTSGGRTADGCNGNTLGRVVGRVFDTQNRFNQYQGNNAPVGLLPNQLLMGASGPTVYASTLEGISRRQLVGGAIAACQSINNGVCSGYIPYCATISKDLFPAMEVPVEEQQQQQQQVLSSPNVVPFGVAGGASSSLPNINNIGSPGLALTQPTAFSNSDPPTVEEDRAPTALGLFA